MSSIVKLALAVVALPQSSVAVKITLVVPVAPQSSLNAMSVSYTHLTLPTILLV